MNNIAWVAGLTALGVGVVLITRPKYKQTASLTDGVGSFLGGATAGVIPGAAGGTAIGALFDGVGAPIGGAIGAVIGGTAGGAAGWAGWGFSQATWEST